MTVCAVRSWAYDYENQRTDGDVNRHCLFDVSIGMYDLGPDVIPIQLTVLDLQNCSKQKKANVSHYLTLNIQQKEQKWENQKEKNSLYVGYNISYIRQWARYWQLKYWTSFYLKPVSTEITHCKGIKFVLWSKFRVYYNANETVSYKKTNRHCTLVSN